MKSRVLFWSMTLVVLSLLVPYGRWVLESEHKVIKRVPTTHQVVALTIDDGPYGKTTQDVLAILKDKEVKATFFVLGRNAEKHPEILAQEVQDGHEVASHAYSHEILSRIPLSQALQEVQDLEGLILKYTEKPRLIRPPGGGYNDSLVNALAQRGYTTVLWDVDPKDWQRVPAEQIVDHVLKQVRPGSIILLHDGQPGLNTPAALGPIIDQLRNRGYQFVTVSELLQYYEVK